MTQKTLSEIIDMMRDLASQMSEDIKQASNRVEHIRVTTRANEAHHILNALEELTGETNDGERNTP